MSNPEKKSKIPEAPAPVTMPGNLLSSVPPPSMLPNFVTATQPPVVPEPIQPPTAIPFQPVVNIPVEQLPPSVQPVGLASVQPQTIQPTPPVADPPSPEMFSPVIPLSKAQPVFPTRSPEDSQHTDIAESLPASTPEMERIGDIMPGSGIFTWVKGAVSTGGILHRVAEKAKSSMDSMITTLDPQMKEYLRSGGDMLIVVASDKDVKISPVREAFQTVFGRATVIGYPAQSDVTALQPVGHSAAYAAAKQRIAHIRATHVDVNNNVPLVAIENYLHEAQPDRWFDISLLLLSLPSLGVELQCQSQGTSVPAAAVAAAKAATPTDYGHAATGFSVAIGAIMADSLQVPHSQWHEASTGVSRRDILLLAARSLAWSYKKMLAISAAES